MAVRSEFKQDQILSDSQVGLLAELVHRLLGPEFMSASTAHGIDTSQSIRLMAVAARCASRREEMGLTVKQSADRMKVPQYRLRAIEGGHVREVRSAVLTRYVSFLGLDAWFRKWVRMNEGFADQLGVVRSGVANPQSEKSRDNRTRRLTRAGADSPPARASLSPRRAAQRQRWADKDEPKDNNTDEANPEGVYRERRTLCLGQ